MLAPSWKRGQPYTDDELSLIDAIHAAPHDDGPRLAYADWQVK